MTPAKLIATRKALGLTQTEMGKRLGLSKRQMIRMETGQTPIRATYSELVRYIENAPGVPPAESGETK
jgi:DNA-binding XRE family transcriptional regulator